MQSTPKFTTPKPDGVTLDLSVWDVEDLTNLLKKYIDLNGYSEFGQRLLDAIAPANLVPDDEQPVDVWLAKGQPHIDQMLHDGKRIAAIKEVRAVFSLGLKEAKDATDRRAKVLGVKGSGNW